MKRSRGTALVESLIVLPTLLMVITAIWQAAMVFRAKSAVNYAVFEAARAGAIDHARLSAITTAFTKGMIPYYGGGTTPAELARSAANAAADLAQAALRVQIISPTQESFTDFASPELQDRFKVSEPVIPNSALDQLTCPRDRPGCASNPASNASGQNLADANLLKLKITYGIPPAKQMPLAGKFYTWALGQFGVGSDDPFVAALIAAQRIPVEAHVVVRMQSESIRNAAMVSDPGPGNNGTPTDPGDPPTPPDLPDCPWWDPTCATCAGGSQDPKCQPDPCPDGHCTCP